MFSKRNTSTGRVAVSRHANALCDSLEAKLEQQESGAIHMYPLGMSAF